MPCYRHVRRATCAQPLLRNVARTYVLTMENSNRAPDYDKIDRICSETYVVYNKGYRACSKAGVSTTNEDIIHAYRNATRHAMDDGLQSVLIIEDDAVFVDDESDWAEVDKFVGAEPFALYSLGTISFTWPATLNLKHHMAHSPFFAPVHATIWSSPAMHEMAAVQIPDVTKPDRQLDNDIMHTFEPKYMYYKPLAVQTFPSSKSQSTWPSTACLWWVKSLQLDRSIFPGWRVLYIGNNMYPILVVTFVATLLVWFTTRNVWLTGIPPALVITFGLTVLGVTLDLSR